jgi:drug/metabolite transporter (DMT)-like permease
MNMGFIFAIGAAMIWGLAYAIDQKILSNISPITLLFISSILAVIVTLPFMISNIEHLKSIAGSGKTILLLVIASGVLATLANFLIFSSIKNLNASLSSIIEIAYPFFVVLFSFIFFRSSLNIYFFIGGILIFIGSIIIIKFA